MSERKNVEAIYPLAPAQRGMLYYCALHPEDRATYFEHWQGTYAGPLDPAALRQAWETIVARHGALRTLFLWERREQPLQVVRRTVEVPWEEQDWRGIAAEEQGERLAALLAEDRQRGFALDRAPITRLTLLRLAEERWRLVWTFHHLVVDGWSMALTLREVHQAYASLVRGTAPELPPARPFKEFVSWLGRRDEAADRAFWTRELAALERPFRSCLPERSRRSAQGAEGEATEAVGGETAGERRVRLPEAVGRRLAAAAGARGLTLFSLTQGAFALLLRRYSGDDLVTYGTVSSGRPPELEGVEGMVGVFMNALPSCIRVEDDATVDAWLREVQLHQVEAREHAHCALEDVQRWAGLPAGEALSDALLVFENYPAAMAGGDIGGLRLLDNRLTERNVFPFSLYVSPRRGGAGEHIDLAAVYDRQRFSESAMDRVLDHFSRLIEGLAAALEQTGGEPVRLADVAMLAPGEGDPVHGAAAPSAGGAEGPRPVHERVIEQARRTPGAVALEAPRPAGRSGSDSRGASKVTYAALDRRSAELAARLREAGAGPGAIVALALERSPEVPIAMLGVLRAGAAFLPIDPAYPEDRIAWMLDDAGVELVVAAGDGSADLPLDGRTVVAIESRDGIDDARDAEPETERPDEPAVGGQDAAYVIYTSGSTGRPKGVVVEHRNLASYVEVAAAEQQVVPGTRVLQLASISFDTSAEEIWPCLTRGGTLVLRDEQAAASGRGFCEFVAEHGIEVADLPTAFWHELAAEVAAGDARLPESLRLVIIGGERALGERLADWWRAPGAEAIRLLNTYGPTETTIVAVSTPLTGGAGGQAASDDPPIGRPIPGARAVLLDASGRPVAPGVAGELAIGGGGVARGYLGRPALTAERFVPDPYAEEPGARLYRTGDLCALTDLGGEAGDRARSEDQVLAFRGRIDGQVKVRGYRIEPGEIESVLSGHPEVGEAAVVARAVGSEGDLRLVAYLAPRADGTEAFEQELPDADSLRTFAGERLPDFMVPALYVPVEALPKTTSGKVDRRALPEPEALHAGGGAVYLAPRTPTEELLAGLWCELLGLDRVGARDDFFALGGHSLLVGRLAARLRGILGVELPLIQIFEHPTVAEMALAVEAAQAGEMTEADRPPELPPLVPVDRSGPLPLSYQQERVWFLQQLVPTSLAYNFQMRVFFRGDLDVAALERSLSEIVRRHEIFRTRFVEEGGRPVQIVEEPWAVELPVTDVAAEAADLEDAERRAAEILAREVSVPFTPSEPPLIRWRLLRLAGDYHQLIQVEHHFVHDGWSVSVLLKELKALYEAFSADQPSPLPELAAQYGDFATWQRGWMEGEVMERLLAYWTRELDGVPTRLDMPFDRPRPRRSAMEGDAIRELLPAELYRTFRSFGRREGFTLFMTMSAVFQALVTRYTGREDYLVGTGIANRRVAEVEPMIGMMVNSLVLRANTSGDPTFQDLLLRVRRSSLGAHAHQDMPFERLVEVLKPERAGAMNPLFQVMFSFHDAAVPDLSFGGLEAGFLVEHNRSAKTDLNIIVAPRAEQRVGRDASEADDKAMVTWEYSTDLFDHATIARLVRHYLTLAAAALENPTLRISELPLMERAEEDQVLREWPGLRTGYPRDAGLAELFAARVAAAPDAPVLRFRGEELSFRQLDERANRIAHRLQELGVRRGTHVALALERSLDLVPAMLGVIKAGGAYVPLDAGYPRERLALMLDDVAAPVLVTQSGLREKLPVGDAVAVLCLDAEAERAALAEAPTAPPEPVGGPATGDDPAYVIYTSGSTGRPKGVVALQRGVSRLVLEADFARLGADQVFLQMAPISFDAATLEIWAPLLNGGRLVVFPPEPPTPHAVREVIEREGVTLFWVTTGLFHQLVEADLATFAPLQQVITGGEVLSPDHARRLLEAHPGISFVNAYGPTENTTYTTCHLVERAEDVIEPVSIGRPIADSDVFVVDPHLRAVPIGVPGELVTGGDGLAWGYWQRPALTAERFVPHPFATEPGARVYRSGDLVRWRPDGRLEFIGRFDSQIKLRGFRIEIGEVERLVRDHPRVAEALVVLSGSGDDKRLVAYVVPEAAEEANDGAEAGEVRVPDGLRGYLGGRLPDYMVPSAFVALERFPLDPNGKFDRRALPEPGFESSEESFVAPRSDLERSLAEIWTDLLPVERVGVQDDFFDLGGHSLAATRIAGRIRTEVGVDVPLTILFDEPTVERLARRIEEMDGGTAAAVVAEAENLSDDELDALLGRMMAGKEG